MANVVDNLLMTGLFYQEELSKFVYDRVFEIITKDNLELLLLAIALLIVTLISLLAMAILIVSVVRDKEYVLFLFLDIPRENIDKILTKCIKFVKFFQESEKEKSKDDDSDNSEESSLEEIE